MRKTRNLDERQREYALDRRKMRELCSILAWSVAGVERVAHIRQIQAPELALSRRIQACNGLSIVFKEKRRRNQVPAALGSDQFGKRCRIEGFQLFGLARLDLCHPLRVSKNGTADGDQIELFGLHAFNQSVETYR